jgi:hypothetical protein
MHDGGGAIAVASQRSEIASRLISLLFDHAINF